MSISSVTKEAILEMWDRIEEYQDVMLKSGEMEHTRQRQHIVWMWNHIRDNIMGLFIKHEKVREKMPYLEHLVATGAITPGFAADLLLKQFMKSPSTSSE